MITADIVSSGTIQIPPACVIEGSGMPGPRELEIPAQTLLPIWSINTARGQFVARVPIAVRIVFDSGSYYAVNEKLNLHGIGHSAQQAVDALCVHVGNAILHYESKSREQVTGLALELKKLYERSFLRA